MIHTTADLERWSERFETIADVPLTERFAAHQVALAELVSRIAYRRARLALRPVRNAS